MKKSKFLIAIIISMIFGCGNNKSDDGKIVITFWHSFVPNTFPALEELIKGFETEHPGIKIRAQYVPTGDALVQKLATAVQSNTAPDISWIHSDFLDKLIQADAIYPISHSETEKMASRKKN